MSGCETAALVPPEWSIGRRSPGKAHGRPLWFVPAALSRDAGRCYDASGARSKIAHGHGRTPPRLSRPEEISWISSRARTPASGLPLSPPRSMPRRRTADETAALFRDARALSDLTMNEKAILSRLAHRQNGLARGGCVRDCPRDGCYCAPISVLIPQQCSTGRTGARARCPLG